MTTSQICFDFIYVSPHLDRVLFFQMNKVLPLPQSVKSYLGKYAPRVRGLSLPNCTLDMNMTNRRCCFLWGVAKSYWTYWMCWALGIAVVKRITQQPQQTSEQSRLVIMKCASFSLDFLKTGPPLKENSHVGTQYLGVNYPMFCWWLYQCSYSSYLVLCNGTNTNLAAQDNMNFLSHSSCETGVRAWLNCSGSPRAETKCGLELGSTGEGSPAAHIVLGSIQSQETTHKWRKSWNNLHLLLTWVIYR